MRTCADALGGAYDEDMFAPETLFVVFLFGALDVPILGEDAARYHAHLGLTMLSVVVGDEFSRNVDPHLINR